MGFLTFLIQGLPLIGRAFTSFDKYQENKMNAAVETTKINGQVDLGVIQARAQLAAIMKDDPATKWGRRLIVYPYGAWFLSVSAYNILKQSPWGEYAWVILDYPPSMQYIGYAIIAYLFATAWKK